MDENRPLSGIQRRSMDDQSSNNNQSTANNLNISQDATICDKTPPMPEQVWIASTENPAELSPEISPVRASTSHAASATETARTIARMPPTSARAKEALRKHLMVKLTRYNDIERELCSESSSPSRSTTPSPPNTSPVKSPPRRYPKRNRTTVNRNVYPYAPAVPSRSRRPNRNTESNFDFDAYDWSPCLVAYEYDKAKNFFPMPGPSTLNYYENMDLPGYYVPLKPGEKLGQRKRKNSTPTVTPKAIKPKRSTRNSNRKLNQTRTDEDEGEEIDESPEDTDIKVQSFYDTSFVFDSPVAGADSQSSPWQSNQHDDPLASPDILPQCIDIDDENFTSTALTKMLQPLVELTATTTVADNKKQWKGNKNADSCTSVPFESAPTKASAQAAIDNFEIAKCVNPAPFYGDPADLNGATKKEIGHTVLQIPGNTINDLQDFQSNLGIVGLYSWRRFALANVTLNAQSNNDSDVSDAAMREFLANESRVVIEPYYAPPCARETKIWLKARKQHTDELSKCKKTIKTEKIAPVVNNSNYQSDEDSPIKIRHEKPKTILADAFDENGIIEIASSPESIRTSPTPIIPLNRRHTRSHVKRTSTVTSLFANDSAEVTCTLIPAKKSSAPRAKMSLNALYDEIQLNRTSQANSMEIDKVKFKPNESTMQNGKHSIYHDSDSRDSDVICLGDVTDDVSHTKPITFESSIKSSISKSSTEDTLVSVKRQSTSIL